MHYNVLSLKKTLFTYKKVLILHKKMFFSQIRSHAQKYFLKVQKNGTDEYLPLPHLYKKHSTQCLPKKKITRNRCLKLKREEIERFKAIEEEKLENSFNIKKCITDLEGLSDIQIENMLKAANISKDSPSNREVFLSFSSDSVRRAWLLQQSNILTSLIMCYFLCF